MLSRSAGSASRTAGRSRTAAAAPARLRRRRRRDLEGPTRHAVRCLHRHRLGCSGRRPVVSRANLLRPVGLRGLPVGFRQRIGTDRPHMAGLSFGGAMALALFRRRRALPKTLILAGASAGWTGSFPPLFVQQRLRAILEASDLPAAEFAAALTPSMFSSRGSARPGCGLRREPGRVPSGRFPRDGDGPGGSRSPGRPAARRCAAAPAVRRPRCARAAGRGRGASGGDPGSRLVVLPGVGHVSPVEAPDRFNAEVRTFLAQR